MHACSTYKLQLLATRPTPPPFLSNKICIIPPDCYLLADTKAKLWKRGTNQNPQGIRTRHLLEKRRSSTNCTQRYFYICPIWNLVHNIPALAKPTKFIKKPSQCREVCLIKLWKKQNHHLHKCLLKELHTKGRQSLEASYPSRWRIFYVQIMP